MLRPGAIVVIPIGAACKEHGPHLTLKNDWLLAEYFKHAILRRAAVLIAPTVNYHYYPAFVEYCLSPAIVDISKAVKDYHPSAKSGLTRDPNGESTYSASGIYGDATLATRQKGAIVVKAIADETKKWDRVILAANIK